jgi:protein-S-isoprenylcysteine O-methyltransferase Ste14
MDGLYRHRFLIRCGHVLFRHRNYVFPLVLLPTILFVAPVFPVRGPAPDRWLDIVIILVGFAGEALRATVVGYAYIKRGGVNKRIYAERLVTTGVFGHARNALYLGNILMLASLLLMANDRWGYLVAAPFFVFAYVAIVAAEEDHLRATFGAEYEAYCRRVNRWIPDFRGFARSIEGLRFSWARVVIKEYSSFFAWVLAVLAIETIETLRVATVAGQAPFLGALLLLFVFSLATFGVARFLKKSGRLRDTPA